MKKKGLVKELIDNMRKFYLYQQKRINKFHEIRVQKDILRFRLNVNDLCRTQKLACNSGILFLHKLQVMILYF